MVKKIDSDEINLLEIYLTIMNNKVKIISIVILTLALTFGFKSIETNEEKNAHKKSKITTKIEAISIYDESQYYSDLNLILDSETIELNRFTLFDLFMKILDTEKERLVKDFNFIKKEDYENEKAYEVAIDNIVSLIKIGTFVKDGKGGKITTEFNGGENLTEAFIEFSAQNEYMSKKWVTFLDTLEHTINKKAQQYLKDSISNKFKNAKIIQKNLIEDIEREIESSLKYYELETKGRLSFLEEQAKIAREGNVESEKVTPSSFGSNYSINYNEDGLLSLYYLKGFRVIEKEIELIKKRKNAYFFAKNIPSLEARKLEIENDPTIIRLEKRFKETLIFDDNNFLGGKVDITSVVLINKYSTISMKMIILAGLIGLIIGVFYVLISNAISNAMIRDRK